MGWFWGLLVSLSNYNKRQPSFSGTERRCYFVVWPSAVFWLRRHEVTQKQSGLSGASYLTDRGKKVILTLSANSLEESACLIFLLFHPVFVFIFFYLWSLTWSTTILLSIGIGWACCFGLSRPTEASLSVWVASLTLSLSLDTNEVIWALCPKYRLETHTWTNRHTTTCTQTDKHWPSSIPPKEKEGGEKKRIKNTFHFP